MSELKNCPFCGSNQEDFGAHPEHCFLFKVKKQAETNCMTYCKEECEIAWNTRQPDPEIKAVYEYIKRECDNDSNYPHHFADEQWEAITSHVEANQ